MRQSHFPREIRELILNALPQDTAVFGQTPDLRYTFIPSGHSRALHPDAPLVEGIRGAGKSFWCQVLQSEKHRQLVEYLMPKIGIKKTTIVSVGFGECPSPGDFPGKDTFVKLIERFDARQVWRTVMLRQIMNKSAEGQLFGDKSWLDLVEWATDHPEDVEQKFYQTDRGLDETDRYHLVLFDALDRSADHWPTMLKIIRGLLQVLLEFRSYRRIRPKAFVRPDHLEDPKTADFADSSKVLSQKVELKWPRNELYGLLWQYLGNEPGSGEMFRNESSDICGVSWAQYEGVWSVPEPLKVEEELQRKVFHAITGPWMGKDRRRGFPYTWLPNHLGDARGQVSPRSFLAAVRFAAEEKSRSDFRYPLYYESIKRGVQEASRIRVREMQEDYPWVTMLMETLSGLTVPCNFKEIAMRWKERNILERLQKDISNEGVKLPPRHLEDGPEGVRQDLETLGIFERMRDGRVNMPDVYRVGYGLGRRGGVKAVARK